MSNLEFTTGADEEDKPWLESDCSDLDEVSWGSGSEFVVRGEHSPVDLTGKWGLPIAAALSICIDEGG